MAGPRTKEVAMIEERFEVLSAVVKHRGRGQVVMAGCGAESTKETIDLVRRAAGVGADMASLLMPSFFAKRMTVDVMERYVVEVADKSPIPVVLYNNPPVAAGVTMRLDLLKRIAGHPKVVGITDSSKETYQENLHAASPAFCVLAYASIEHRPWAEARWELALRWEAVPWEWVAGSGPRSGEQVQG